MRIIVGAFLWLVICLTAGCGDEYDQGTDLAQLAAMEQEIIDLIGTPTCDDDSVCVAIAFGAKACGGPMKYLIYSNSSVDRSLLESKVNKYNEFNRVLNQRHGWMSDCSVPVRPELECREGVCSRTGRIQE